VLGVEPAVLEDRQRDASRSSRLDNLEGLGRISGQRLVNHHGDPGVNTLPSLTSVKTAGGGKHNQIQTRNHQQGVKVSDNPRSR
jgi:hypothetical protein